jgi:hypothetical protein
VVTLDAVTYRSGLTSAARQGDAADFGIWDESEAFEQEDDEESEGRVED